MKVTDLYEKLVNNASEKLDKTCDGIIIGDGNKEVKKVGTCFNVTREVILSAVKKGIDTIVCHEPVFIRKGDEGKFNTVNDFADKIEFEKKELIEKNNIAIIRFHDHAHLYSPDLIHESFLLKLGVKCKRLEEGSTFGIARYELENSMLKTDFISLVKEKICPAPIKTVGSLDGDVKVIALGLGWTSFEAFESVFVADSEIYVTGEMDEVISEFSFLDVCKTPKDRLMLLLGHYTSEYSGMELLAKRINEYLPAEFLTSGEAFKII